MKIMKILKVKMSVFQKILNYLCLSYQFVMSLSFRNRYTLRVVSFVPLILHEIELSREINRLLEKGHPLTIKLSSPESLAQVNPKRTPKEGEI